MKNIPVTSKTMYITKLVEQGEKFVKRLRWLVFFHEKPNRENSNKYSNSYGFKSPNTPPANPRLAPFEEDFYELMRTVKFRPVYNKFQSELKKDIKNITKSDKLTVFADKSSNVYPMDKKKYEKLILEIITQKYQKANNNASRDINKEAKNISRSLDLEKRVERLTKRDAFITLKDHKSDFQSRPQCRLINPAKSEIGLISKRILENVVKIVAQKTKVNQWRNTASVIDWFKAINDKNRATFLKFDVKDFYPSISCELIKDSLSFARTYADISAEDEKIILHACNSLLFYKEGEWVKKEVEGTLDITMVSYGSI